MEHKTISNLKELKLYMYLVGDLRFNEYKSDSYIKDYITNLVYESDLDSNLDYYMEEADLNINTTIELLTSVFLNDPEQNDLYDSIYELLIYLGFDNNICYDLKEFNTLIHEKIHYKDHGLYKGSYYYYNEFNISISSDSYIFINHGTKTIKNLESFNINELEQLLNELLTKYIKELDPFNLMELINLINISNNDYDSLIVTNSYNNRLKVFNEHEFIKLNNFNDYDQFIYINNIYDHKIKSIPKEEVINYLDIDLLMDQFMDLDPELLCFMNL